MDYLLKIEIFRFVFNMLYIKNIEILMDIQKNNCDTLKIIKNN